MKKLRLWELRWLAIGSSRKCKRRCPSSSKDPRHDPRCCLKHRLSQPRKGMTVWVSFHQGKCQKPEDTFASKILIESGKLGENIFCCCFSRVRLFATPWTVACQASLSIKFPRQEYWSGLPLLLQRIFLTQGPNHVSGQCVRWSIRIKWIAQTFLFPSAWKFLLHCCLVSVQQHYIKLYIPD